MTREAVEIADLYKARWAIELLFRWLKQHLSIRKFLGKNENAIKLQLLAAMIAFLLLRIAAHGHSVALPALRFAELAGRFLFACRPVASIDEPPPKYRVPSRWKADSQLKMVYA
jgi:IS4 transposase